MYKPNQTAWEQFPKKVQLGNIAAELARAARAGLREDKTERDPKELGAYERALALIDASLKDAQWKDETDYLHTLRNAVAALYAGIPSPALGEYIHKQLLTRSKVSI